MYLYLKANHDVIASTWTGVGRDRHSIGSDWFGFDLVCSSRSISVIYTLSVSNSPPLRCLRLVTSCASTSIQQHPPQYSSSRDMLYNTPSFPHLFETVTCTMVKEFKILLVDTHGVVDCPLQRPLPSPPLPVVSSVSPSVDSRA